MEYCIYKLTSPTGRVYVGFTNNFTRRMTEHFYDSSRRRTKLYRSIKRYGWDFFQKEVLWEGICSLEDITRAEIFYIALFNAMEDGLNETPGGNGWPAGKPNPAVTKARAGSKASLQTRRKMSNSHRGKKQSQSHIFKRASARTGVPQRPETVAKRTTPIAQYTVEGIYIQSWPSQKDAIVALGITTILDCLKGRQQTAGGFIWKYA